MKTVERMTKIFNHQEADHIPIYDVPWDATIERWQGEGMPPDADYREFFDLDRVRDIFIDTSPKYEEKTIEETDEHRIFTSGWGVTLRKWKHAASTPEFLDFTIKTPEDWAEAKKRMDTSPDRIDWEKLKQDYAKWQEEGAWIQVIGWFGFDITHSWIVGTERILMALMENPDWCRDMFETELEKCLALYDRIWDAGYRFHSIKWPDDMGYKGKQFFSLDMYRNLLKPIHQRAIDWAHEKGIKAHLHSCGDVRPFIPEFIEMGLDALNPLEVKAGMDPLEIKREYGRDIVLHGGIDALLYHHPEKLHEEIDRLVPELKKDGGFVFSSDHSVPSNVSLEEFRKMVDHAKQVGSY